MIWEWILAAIGVVALALVALLVGVFIYAMVKTEIEFMEERRNDDDVDD